ncbi:MAG: hypothetical protein QF726_00680 [Alphaproteobacteria bacterium]|jgi:hypothetical protein|nr:hypothetical protein [Rhodospirillaceae bacterium]MDP7488008.1 hypothetical protein [Alphaproteobacteria bacterium]MDP7538968.1 hypothetical protein [Alphaproteobacteria bacterium]|tara:strand:+ start:1310 stop:1906 length:597 start_codon:yes stop_codon:yes gene_type:complete
MFEFDPFGNPIEDSSSIAFRDILFLMVFSLVVVIFLLTFLVNPVPKPNDVPLRTQILIEATWPSGTGYDVDLWGMGPDGIPVGWGIYEAGPSLNLERDDRGKINDLSELNYEWMSIRTRNAGEYVVNIHLYNQYKEPLPVPVKVRVTGKGDIGEIYETEILLKRRKEEVTVVRFTLDADGKLIEDSVHNLYKSILRHR